MYKLYIYNIIFLLHIYNMIIITAILYGDILLNES